MRPFRSLIEEINEMLKKQKINSVLTIDKLFPQNMATLRNKRNLAAVSREKPEKKTRNNQSQNTLNPGMAEEYVTQVSEEIECVVTKKLFPTKKGGYWKRT